MPEAVVDLLRELSRRGQHGVHISALGSVDLLAEMELRNLPFLVTDWTKANTWGDKIWVIPDAVYRFSEGRR